MHDFSIELAAEKIYDSKTKDYFSEVYKSYTNGCYRSSLVMLWSVVICDLIYKLQSLCDLHDDSSAKSILDEISNQKEEDRRNPAWEAKLLELVALKTQLIDEGERTQLAHLQHVRHLSAHPVLTSTDLLYRPTKETARSYIRHALEAVLLKPPLFSKKIVSTIVKDIAENKQLSTNKETLKKYLSARYFINMPKNVKLELFRTLWKFCFRTQNTDTIAHREINVMALGIVFDSNPQKFRSAIENDRTYFSNIEIRDDLLTTMIGFLAERPSLYGSLSEEARSLIAEEVRHNFSLKLIAEFIYDNFAAHIEAVAEASSDGLGQADPQSWLRFLDLAEQNGRFSEAADIAIGVFVESRSYDGASNNFKYYIQPLLDRSDAVQLKNILAAFEKNSQVSGHRRAEQDKQSVKTALRIVESNT